jgi:hypothetical protein
LERITINDIKIMNWRILWSRSKRRIY